MDMRGYQRSSFLNWRLPTLATIEASLPSMLIARVVLALVGASAVWLLSRRLPRAAVDQRLATLAAGFTMLPIWVIGDILFMHEVWAGELIALSLALRSRDRWVPSLGVGLAAALVRELALVYLVAMLAVAMVSRRWRGGDGTRTVAIVLVVGGLALHAHAVAPLIRLVRSTAGSTSAARNSTWPRFGPIPPR